MKPYARNTFRTKTNYTESLKRFYDTQIEQLNFNDAQSTADRINGDVSVATHKMIDKIVDPNTINSDTMQISLNWKLITATFRLILLNTVYFKGDWMKKFTPIGKTIPFYNSENDVQHVSLYLMRKHVYRKCWI